MTDNIDTNNDHINDDQLNNDLDNQKKTEKNFFHKHQKSILLICLFAVSILGGFLGNTLATHFRSSKQPVFYQSVTTDKNSNKNANSITEISKKTIQSVVEIQTEAVSTNSFFPQAVTSGAGSGVILSKDGYIVTNHHVIDGADKIRVTTHDHKSYNAKLIGYDSSTDLAVVKIEADNLIPAILGSSKSLEVGNTAIAIGNPLGELGGTVTSGIISATDREITIDNQQMQLLQTNAAINPGNSGGGLFNDRGELIGIVNAKSSGENIEGLGFAIPIDHAKPIIESLIKNGFVKDRASLGVMLSVANNPMNPNTSAVFIIDVEKGKAADKAGLKVGDQILKIENKKVTDISDIKTVINNHKSGDTITLKVLRENDTKDIKVVLGQATQENK